MTLRNITGTMTLLLGMISCSQFCEIDGTFHLLNDSVSLLSTQSSLWSKPGVGSSAACASDCGRDELCLSFLYNSLEDMCTAHSFLVSPGQLTSGQEMCYSIDMWDCFDVLKHKPGAATGVYTVYPGEGDPMDVYCDMTNDGGGWTVIQRRRDGSQDFYKDWDTCKEGFGILTGELWLGNNKIHLLTTERNMQLRIDMIDREGQSGFATYSTFSVGDESSNYILTVSGFAGDKGDSFSPHDGMMFSTLDRDNDKSSYSCAVTHKGSWWYANCHKSHLNGLYGSDVHGDGINWKTWHGYEYSLKATIMKLRPI